MTLNPMDILALPGLANAAVHSVGSALDRLVPGSNSFADHLKKAQGDTDRLPVEIGRGVEVELTQEQMARIAEAADRAEAEGASSAVVMIDGMALELDVMLRTIRSVVDQESGLKTGIDAVVYAGNTPESKPVTGPTGLASNTDVRKIIGDQAA